MEKVLNAVMDDIDRAVSRIIQPCKSSFGRRRVIGLAEAREGVFLRIGEGETVCAHALEENFIQIFHQFSRFNIRCEGLFLCIHLRKGILNEFYNT